MGKGSKKGVRTPKNDVKPQGAPWGWAKNGQKWQKMGKKGLKWPKMTKNGQKDQKGQKWSCGQT